MFGLHSRQICGLGEIKLHFHPKKLFQDITLSGNVKKFMYEEPFSYMALTHKAAFEFKNRNHSSPFSHHITFSDHRIFIEGFPHFGTSVSFLPAEDTTIVQRFTYQFRSPHAIHGWNTGIIAEYSKDHTKLIGKANFSYRLIRLKRTMELRLNAGMFLSENGGGADKYSFRLNNSTGNQDYLYSDLYLGRSETDGFLARQIGQENGNFFLNTPIGVNKEWIFSAHFNSGIPYIPFIKVYGTLGMVPAVKLANIGGTQYEAGVFVSIAGDAVKVFLPLAFSKNIKDILDARGSDMLSQIRFSFDLNRINPLDKIRNFEL